MNNWRRSKEYLAPPDSLSKSVFLDRIQSGQFIPFEKIRATLWDDPSEPRGYRRMMPTYAMAAEYELLRRARYDLDLYQRNLANYEEYSREVLRSGAEPLPRDVIEQRVEELEKTVAEAEERFKPAQVWKYLDLSPREQDVIWERLLEARIREEPANETETASDSVRSRTKVISKEQADSIILEHGLAAVKLHKTVRRSIRDEELDIYDLRTYKAEALSYVQEDPESFEPITFELLKGLSDEVFQVVETQPTRNIYGGIIQAALKQNGKTISIDEAYKRFNKLKKER